MANGNIFTVDAVGRFRRVKNFRTDMKTKLVTKEVKVDPCVCLAALTTSQHIAVKYTGGFFVFHRVGEVKDCQLFRPVSIVAAFFDGALIGRAFMNFGHIILAGFIAF